MKIYKNMEAIAGIVNEILYFHKNMSLLAFHADIM